MKFFFHENFLYTLFLSSHKNLFFNNTCCYCLHLHFTHTDTLEKISDFTEFFLFFSEKMLSIYQLSCERRNLVFCFDNFCEIVFCFLQRILISFSCGIMNNQNIGRTYYSSCKKNNSFFFREIAIMYLFHEK